MRPRSSAGAMATVLALAVAMAACGDGDSDSEPTLPPDPGTHQGDDPRDLVAEAAVADELAGLPELTEHVRRSLRDDPQVCDEPEPAADDRVAIERRAFATGTPEDEFVEIQQTTTAYRDAAAAEIYVAESQRILGVCGESSSEGQITRDYEVVDMPGDAGGEAIAAVMIIPGPDDEFTYRRGCVQRELLVQCTQVWSVDEESADRYFAEALAEGAASLEAADLG